MIGPFKQFTSIIGPNGSGKSNLMDAISFVLGVQSAQLRGAALRDLVYSFDLADKEERRTAYVKLVYEAEDGVETVFSRHITAAGTGEYRVDGRACPAEAYNERLKRHGILVKARNFLVFQGDIESVASKSPKDLTALIEQISGSEDVKKDYEEAMKGRHKAEEDQHAAFAKRKTLAAQRKQMREQKEEAEKHARMTEELQRLRVEHVLFKLFHIDFDTRRHEAEIAEAEEELRAREARVEAAAREMEEKRRLKASRAKDVLVLGAQDRQPPRGGGRQGALHRARAGGDGAREEEAGARDQAARARAADAETGAADAARLGARLAQRGSRRSRLRAGAGEEGQKGCARLGRGADARVQQEEGRGWREDVQAAPGARGSGERAPGG